MKEGLIGFASSFPYKHKNIFLIILSYCVFAIGGALYWAAIPILSEQDFHLNAFTASLIMSIIGVVYMLTDGPIGVFLDYVGYKKGAAISLIFAGITALISILNPSLPMFIIGIIFFALAWNAITLATSAYVLYDVPKKKEGKIFGAYGMFYKLGVFISTFFIGYIASWGISKVGLFFLFTVLISLFLILFFLKSEKRNYDHNFMHAFSKYWHSPSQLKRGWKAMKEFYPISWVWATSGFIGYIYSSILWFVIPLSLANFAGNSLPEAVVLSMYEFAGIIFVAVGGFLADKYSRKKLFLTLLFILGLASIALCFASQLSTLLILTFLVAAALDATTAPVEAMIAQVDKKHDKDGTIAGFVGIFTDFAFIVGPISSGILLVNFGLKGVFIFLGTLVFVNWIVSYLLLRNFEGKPNIKIKKRHTIHLGGMPRHHKH